MKKIFISFFSFAVVVLLAGTVFAANSQGTGSQGSQNTGQGSGTGPGAGQGQQGSGSQPIQNQNQVQTQNQGEEQQLQVGTKEQQGEETGKGSNSNSKNTTSGQKKGLNESMSSVAQQVQRLLTSQSTPGGIGDQVREWARAQNQSQTRIQEHLANVEGKTGLMKSIFGPDYSSLKGLKQEMEQNRVRIQQLEQLKLKLTDQAGTEDVQQMITLLQQENTALQDRVNLEEQNGGLLGWLMKMFAK